MSKLAICANIIFVRILQTKGVFELNIKNAEGEEQIWTLDLKKEGTVKTGKAGKADCTIKMDDAVFIEIASGKLNCKILTDTRSCEKRD